VVTREVVALCFERDSVIQIKSKSSAKARLRNGSLGAAETDTRTRSNGMIEESVVN